MVLVKWRRDAVFGGRRVAAGDEDLVERQAAVNLQAAGQLVVLGTEPPQVTGVVDEPNHAG